MIPTLTVPVSRDPTQPQRSGEGGHWYGRDGRPQYTVTAKNGQPRAATLRDARVHGWVPGFSTIAKLEAAPALTDWLVNQAIMAALTIPRIEGESLESLKERVVKDAGAQAEKARERGSQLHDALEQAFRGRPFPKEEEPFVHPVMSWVARHFPGQEWVPEVSFSHRSGYGGKVDLISGNRSIIVDFKTKSFGPEDAQKRFGYSSHAMQLWAYSQGLDCLGAKKVNLFLSTTVPGLIVSHEWGPDTVHELEAFGCLLRLWQLRKAYPCSW